MASQIGEIFYSLQQYGVYDYILPFLLVFAIIFAILEKTRIFGEQEGKAKSNINMVVSLVIGLLLVAQTEIVSIINTFLPKIALIIVVAIMFLIVAGLFGAEEKGWTGAPFMIAFVLCIIAVIWALTPTTGWPQWLRLSQQDKVIIFLVAAVILTIAYIGREPKTESGFEKIIKGLTKR